MSAKKPANDDRLRYNWSGHVTMDTATNGFFKETMHKTESIEVRFRHGLLPLKSKRNPLVMERSPREKVKPFDFSVPPKQPEEARWNYPEADLGILAKFPSQKEQFDLQREKERIYDENVKRLEIIKAQREAEMAAEQAKHVARLNGPEASTYSAPLASSTKSGLIDAMTRYDDEGKWKTNTFESSNNKPEMTAQKKSSKQKKSFYEQPISTFKNLGTQNPDMLASWRAKRAADFINKQGNPLEPPTNVDMEGLEPFRPAGGTLTLKRSTKKFGSSGSLPALEDALKATNAAIAKQQLKLQSHK